MPRLLALLGALGTAVAVAASSVHGDDLLTPKHEAGRCAIRGHCGKLGFFGKPLPCVDNGLAEDPDAELREQLVSICGAKWSDGPICCNAEQVDALKSNLGRANQMIESCPACKENFYNLFCTFTCSPDQSLFVNVTKTTAKNGKSLVTELDQLISDDYGSGFYDSCKDVKFGATNARAMDFIGGGAKDHHGFLKFLGDKKALGSPFQMNFPQEYSEPDMAPTDMDAKRCSDEGFRCACVDCPEVCATLPDVQQTSSCRVGVLPCLSFASIFTYSILLFTYVALIVGRTVWKRHATRRMERRQLLQDGRPSDDEDEGDLIESEAMQGRPQAYYKLNTWCDVAFSKLGHFAATYRGITIGTSLVVVGILSLGLLHFDLEKNPARLWVSPTSAAAQEKAYFDSHFGPFYRAEQVFVVNDTSGKPEPVLSYDNLLWWMGVEDHVSKLKGPNFGSTLRDVCFKPLGSDCVVQSVTQYWESDPDMVDPDSWKERLDECAASPVSCRPAYGQPIDPSMVLGGWESDAIDATAMTITWVVNNGEEDSYQVSRAMDWEHALKDYLLEVQQQASDRGLRLSFSTDISLEQELNKSTNTDAKIVAISYLVMFLYVSLALGSTTTSLRETLRNPAIAVVQSKFGLGVVGILIVLLSIIASIGLFSWSGIKATLIIAEVIPFIVLAVGVDNIFLLVHEFERVNISHPDEMVEERIARTLGRMGPSILFSAITETCSFALGAFVGMPAVRNFAIYAAGAVFINALLQVTMFVSLLAQNQIRAEDHRADCLPCLQLKSARIHLSGTNGHANPRLYEVPEESLLQQFIRRFYARWILKEKVKKGVVIFFFGLFAAGLALIPEIKLGLDQRDAIPDDSYLIPYFNDLYDYLGTGPPVYFVAKEANATQRHVQQELCARFTSCDSLSLTNLLEGERKRPEVSYIATPTASWFDDFFLWLSPTAESCCIEDGNVCFEDRDPAWNISMHGMPEGDEFLHYLTKFLSSPTDEECPLGGKATYSQAVVVDEERKTIAASHFRTMHTRLRGQDDFINSYAAARRIASDMTEQTGIEVFPYSIHYIFFDQYLSIVPLTGTLLGSALAMILVVASILLGSPLTAIVVTLTVVMTIVDIMGAMAVFGVSLNAVSLVNLVICIGISVEFCAHVARAFVFPSRTVMERAPRSYGARDARAWTALVNVGASVFSGITITKLLGVCVLAFTRSKIFDIYYFRVWLALVIFAALHALVFLPVALSIAGGRGYADPESEGGIEEDLASRRYRALMPGEDSDDDSEEED
jgi:Niemann-Pick C1 protein